jgi:hypothetical protein
MNSLAKAQRRKERTKEKLAAFLCAFARETLTGSLNAVEAFEDIFGFQTQDHWAAVWTSSR